MWSLILYFLFGIGNASNGNHNQSDNQNGSSTIQTYSTPPPTSGGDKENPRPPKI